MTARYAIYYAPAADSALWRKASAWLGRDAVAGARLAHPAVPGLEGLDVAELTAGPRHYGFHATLKAPFELASGRSEGELLAAAADFAGGLSPFEAQIAPAALGRFLAFRLQDGEAEMAALHAACVRAFEAFRAPPDAADLVRRRKAPLTPGQDRNLAAWGYPYVFEDFRFHMTLTGAIRDDLVRERVLSALRIHFADETGPHRFEAVAVFRQPDRDAPFDIVERFAFPAALAA